MIVRDIKDLEREKLYGRRAIDDIDSDIKIRKNEIIELQRKYLINKITLLKLIKS